MKRQLFLPKLVPKRERNAGYANEIGKFQQAVLKNPLLPDAHFWLGMAIIEFADYLTEKGG